MPRHGWFQLIGEGVRVMEVVMRESMDLYELAYWIEQRDPLSSVRRLLT